MKWKRVNQVGASLGGTRTCTECEKTKPVSEFYKEKTNASGYRSRCRECMKSDSKARYASGESTAKLRNARTLAERAELKRKLVESAGGRCNRCGYNRSFSALEFHHISSDKEYEMAILITRARGKNGEHLRLAIAEAAKCVLLCSNCHRELHDGMWSL
jgi:hypothetical protein